MREALLARSGRGAEYVQLLRGVNGSNGQPSGDDFPRRRKAVPDDEAGLLDGARRRLVDNAVTRSARTPCERGQAVGEHGG